MAVIYLAGFYLQNSQIFSREKEAKQKLPDSSFHKTNEEEEINLPWFSPHPATQQDVTSCCCCCCCSDASGRHTERTLSVKDTLSFNWMRAMSFKCRLMTVVSPVSGSVTVTSTFCWKFSCCQKEIKSFFFHYSVSFHWAFTCISFISDLEPNQNSDRKRGKFVKKIVCKKCHVTTWGD